MKHSILALFAAFSLIFMSGCGNLSPRVDPKLDQKIDNQNGKIGEIENMQNSMKAEVGKLQNQNEITNSKLDRLQQGFANWQSNFENSGIQILSGPGGISVALLGLLVFGALTFHYRSVAKANEKTANILAAKIVNQNDPQLVDAVFEAALYTNVEENVLNLIKKHRSLLAP